MENELESAVSGFFKVAAQTGLELRPGQVEMAKEAAEAIALKRPLAVEAEVGIGKSFAYLVPALLQYQNNRCQIVIATSTIALQEQLCLDAHTVLRMLGIEGNVILAKGMKQYACCKKVQSLRRRHPRDTFLTQAFRFCRDGMQDKAQMDLSITDEEWEQICINNFGGKRCRNCEQTAVCIYAQMRSRILHGNDIVICNHNMLVAHLRSQQKVRSIFNPTMSTLIVDEAHHIESVFRDSFTKSYDQSEIIRTLKRCKDGVKQREQRIAAAINDTVQLFSLFRGQIEAQQEATPDDRSVYYLSVTPSIKRLLGNIKHFIPAIQREQELSELYQFLRKVYHGGMDSILWLNDEEAPRLCVCKKDIRSDIRTMLYQPGQSTILTSATITGKADGTPREQYEYFLDSIGFPNIGLVSVPKKSPFDYERNTMLYCSKNLPYPKHDDMERYRERSIPEIVDLLRITNGKALILFTAKADMLYVYKKLSNMELPYRILLQSKGSSQEYQLDKFRSDICSVLLGTGTYWEGINVKGESLSQLIIFKLPFPCPDPITDYKMSLTDHPIQDVVAPEMLIRLRQGVGRLIRSETDCGIVSILDPRALNGYRKEIQDALPMKRVTGEMQEIAEFWDYLTSNRQEESQ